MIWPVASASASALALAARLSAAVSPPFPIPHASVAPLIDDVKLVCGPFLFSDGFETGLTTHWSSEAP